MEHRSPQLDLRVPPRPEHLIRTHDDLSRHDRTFRRDLSAVDERERRRTPDQRRDTQRGRSAGEEVRISRQIDGRHVDHEGQSPRRSRERQVDRDKYGERTNDRQSRRRDSSQLTRRVNRHRGDSRKARDGGSSPSSSDDDSDYKDSSDGNRRRRRSRGPSRPRHRGDPSPDMVTSW